MGRGTGPGVITPDGCAVDFYRVLPAMGEPEVVHGAILAGAGILELGAGAGRMTHPLDEAVEGERVTGGIVFRLRDLRRPGPGLVETTVEYQVGERVWSQTFTAERVDNLALEAALAEAGLAVDAYLTGDGSWVRAVPVSRARALGRSPR